MQTFVLDALAPLNSVMEWDNRDEDYTKDKVMQTVKAVELLDNANPNISYLRQLRIVTDLNKSLTPYSAGGQQF